MKTAEAPAPASVPAGMTERDFTAEIEAELERLRTSNTPGTYRSEVVEKVRKSITASIPEIREWLSFVEGCTLSYRTRVMKSPQSWTALFRRDGLYVSVEVTGSLDKKKILLVGGSHRLSADGVKVPDIAIPFAHSFVTDHNVSREFLGAVFATIGERGTLVIQEAKSIIRKALDEAPAVLDAATNRESKTSNKERDKLRTRIAKAAAEQHSAPLKVSDMSAADVLSVLRIDDVLKNVDSLVSFASSNPTLDEEAMRTIIRIVQAGGEQSIAILLNLSRTGRGGLAFADESDIESALNLARVQEIMTT